MRKLASKSAEASKNMTALIEGSIQAVEKGIKLADEQAQMLKGLVGKLRIWETNEKEKTNAIADTRIRPGEEAVQVQLTTKY